MSKEILPYNLTERDIKYAFLKLDNPKEIIDKMDIYDDKKSHNINCVEFLNKMENEHRLSELYNNIINIK